LLRIHQTEGEVGSTVVCSLNRLDAGESKDSLNELSTRMNEGCQGRVLMHESLYWQRGDVRGRAKEIQMAKVGTINDDFVDDLIKLVAKHWPNKPGAPDDTAVRLNQLDIIASLQAPLDVVVTGVYGIPGNDLVTGFFDELEELDQLEDFTVEQQIANGM
jgi:hypothetical protein